MVRQRNNRRGGRNRAARGNGARQNLAPFGPMKNETNFTVAAASTSPITFTVVDLLPTVATVQALKIHTVEVGIAATNSGGSNTLPTVVQAEVTTIGASSKIGSTISKPSICTQAVPAYLVVHLPADVEDQIHTANDQLVRLSLGASGATGGTYVGWVRVTYSMKGETEYNTVSK